MPWPMIDQDLFGVVVITDDLRGDHEGTDEQLMANEPLVVNQALSC